MARSKSTLVKEAKSIDNGFGRLLDFLDEHGGSLLWSRPDHEGDGFLTCWSVNGHPIIIQKHNENLGWNVFRPASKSGEINQTLKELAEFLYS